MVKDSQTSPLAMPGRAETPPISGTSLRVSSDHLVPAFSKGTSSHANPPPARNHPDSDLPDAKQALRKLIWRRVLYLVYEEEDIATVKVLCCVNKTIGRMAEELLYEHLVVVSRENLGMLARLSLRLRGLIRSLEIRDETPTPHSDPSTIWRFIGTLPNLISLDIQHALIIWNPPHDLLLPQLQTLKLRIIGLVSEYDFSSRVSASRHSSNRSFAKQLALKLDTREPDDWIARLVEQTPNLAELAVTFAGPCEKALKRVVERHGRRPYRLRTLELRLAEGQWENLAELVLGIAGNAAQLEHLIVHGYEGGLNWMGGTLVRASQGIVTKIHYKSLKTIKTILHRHHCDGCQGRKVMDNGKRIVQPARPSLSQHTFDDLHAWFNVYWRTSSQFESFTFQVIRSYGPPGTCGGHDSPWEETFPTHDELIWHFKEHDLQPELKHRGPGSHRSRIHTSRMTRFFEPMIDPPISVMPPDESYEGPYREQKPGGEEWQCFDATRPLPDGDLEFLQAVTSNEDLQQLLLVHGAQQLREAVRSQTDGRLESQQSFLARLKRNDHHHEEVTGRLASKAKGKTPSGGQHQGKAYSRADIDRAKLRKAKVEDDLKIKHRRDDQPGSVKIFDGRQTVDITKQQLRQVMADGPHDLSEAEHEDSDAPIYEVDISNHASDCHCDRCAPRHRHSSGCKCEDCLACTCDPDIGYCCHHRGLSSRNHCLLCGKHISDFEDGPQVELYVPQLGPVHDDEYEDFEQSDAETEIVTLQVVNLDDSGDEDLKPPETFKPRPKPRPKRG